MPRESDFQKSLKQELKHRFPGCYVFKNSSSQYQGVPDLTILYKDHWATLEVKESRTASHRPNQDIRVKRMNEMSFSSFIFPENKKEVLDGLTAFFES